MKLTRRDILRNAALASLGGVGAGLMTGCKPYRFDKGVRIFFAGAWVFCKDLDAPNQRMSAITMDPGNMSAQPLHPACPIKQAIPLDTMTHRFPFGIWEEIDDWNQAHNSRQLADNTKTKTSFEPHMIQLRNYLPSVTLDQLFSKANSESRFTCLKAGQYKGIPWGNPLLRVVSLPIPARIIPAAFRRNATVNDSRQELQECTHQHDLGVAMTHIFDYPGATRLDFTSHDGLEEAMAAGHGPQGDFHFHSIPPDSTLRNDHSHVMFSHLLDLIDPWLCTRISLLPRRSPISSMLDAGFPPGAVWKSFR